MSTAAQELSVDTQTTAGTTVEDRIKDRRSKLMQKFDFESAQGILPFTNEKYFEQSNPIVRSSLFSASKMGGSFEDWTEIFSFGSGSIHYRGPALTVDHEQVLVRLMVLARGRSLTKPINVRVADIRKWLDIADSGQSYAKARRILDDLAKGEIRISCKQALARLYHLLTVREVGDRPDGRFFKDFLDNRFGPQIKMIGAALNDDSNTVDISMRFISNQVHDSRSRRLLVSLDPIMAIFFDGVNTTLVPFEVLDQCDRFGKKLLAFIASHRDGVFPIRLEHYFYFSRSRSEYSTVKRRFKSDMKKRLTGWEEKGFIEPGWEIYQNNAGDEIVRGLKCGEMVRIKSELEQMKNLEDGDDL